MIEVSQYHDVPRPSYHDIPILAGMSDGQLSRLISVCDQVDLAPGDRLYSEGDPAQYFYIVLDGEIQVSRNVEGQEVLLNTYKRGDFTGEMSLLLNKPYLTTTTAITRARLMRLNSQAFNEQFLGSSPIASIMLPIMAKRIESADILVHQRAKLASLGKMSAGLAHELNNPAAAAARAASQLRDTIRSVNAASLKLSEQQMTHAELASLSKMSSEITDRPESLVPLDPMAQSDREDEIINWLDDHSIDDSYTLAPTLVRQGITVDRLEMLVSEVGDGRLPDVLAWLEGTLNVAGLLDEVEQSTKRISELIAAVKSYTYMDQAPLKEIDLHEGLESTLIMLRHKLKGGIEVVKSYDGSIPRIWAYGSELNQVWTNIIDNAIDAMEGHGRLFLKTWRQNGDAFVEIADNGPGIAPENQGHIFEPFFTTKGVGEGLGLGLDTSYKIIVNHHHGDIKVASQPGDTRFVVRIPLEQPAPPMHD
jgi:signal transduction histidine kinase